MWLLLSKKVLTKVIQTSDRDVKIWQRALSEMGLYSGLIDGDFGDGTRRASFLGAYGLLI